MDIILQEALKYLERGISIIPMTTYVDRNGEVKKKPLIAWTEFESRLPLGEEVKRWWTKNPRALIGGVCGKVSNLSVVDCDNPGAVDLYTSLIVKEPIKKTPTSKTPRGGNHFFYNAPENCPGPISTSDGLDFRGPGSLIILPPSQNCKGGRYEFLPGFSFEEIERPLLPQSIIDFVRSHSFSKKSGEGFNGQMFQDGNRDNSLFHTALCLVKGGMSENGIYQVLTNLIISWGEAPDQKWIQAKVQSALKRQAGRERNLTQEVRDLISITSGYFRASRVYQEIPNGSKISIRVILSRLVEEGILERVGKEDGVFRRIENAEQRIDIRQKSSGEVKLWMPFCLGEKVKILPKNIITVGGTPDSGKTGFLLNIAKENRNSHNVFYFTSEMGLAELQERIDKMEITRDEWQKKITTIEQSSNFSDVIRPEGLNIIDFLELSGDDYLKVGEHIRRIWEKLTTGVCFIAIQKRYGTDLPQGGIAAIEKARLALSFDRGMVKIVKAKNWRDGKSNPNGLEMEFKLVDGWKFIECGPWTKATQPVKIPTLYNETMKQHRQGTKRVGKTELTKEFEKIFS